MSSLSLRSATRLVISMACSWWGIMSCMNPTSAAVYGGGSMPSRSSSLSSLPASPGAAGWTMLGAESSLDPPESPPSSATKTTATATAASTPAAISHEGGILRDELICVSVGILSAAIDFT